MRLPPLTRTAAALCALVLLPSLFGCGARKNARQSNSPPSGAQQTPAECANPASTEDAAKLDADIEQLEKQAERNPADDDARDELAKAYVRRGNLKRAAGQLQEALIDYQSALRQDPDNDEAQNNAAAIEEQIGGTPQGENGEPAPLPITPNVADEDGNGEKAAKPTPKKQ